MWKGVEKMSDAKTDYSHAVTTQKDNAKEDVELADKINAGFERKSKWGKEWGEVDINEVVGKIAPGAKPVFENGKIVYYNENRTLAVVADVSGYLRVQDLRGNTKHRKYLDQHGKETYNFADENGKKRGRSKEDFKKATHYIIKKRKG